MEPQHEVTLDLTGPAGDTVGTLLFELLPGDDRAAEPRPLLNEQLSPDRERAMEPVQLLEAHEYVYTITLPESATITVEPADLFQPDPGPGTHGRLRTGLRTGYLPIKILVDGTEVARAAVEVRSYKMDYLSHYQWMMEDLTEAFSGLVTERFAATQQRFEQTADGNAATLYQRFAFLRSLLEGPAFRAAIQQILAYPHRTWTSEPEWRQPGRSVPPSSAVARQLARPGRRVLAPGQPALGGTMPYQIQVQRTEETLDTPENRFVRFALTKWRERIAQVQSALKAEESNKPVERGLRETSALMDRLDIWLGADLFHEVGEMAILPFASQVLQKRSGYREVFRAFILSEAATALSWRGGDDVYAAGQRNVAILYEFWVFLQVTKVVAGLCNQTFTWDRLLVPHDDQLGIGLRRGAGRRLKGTVEILGRRLRLELWYNRSFRPGTGRTSSWTRQMDPDMSLRIRVIGPEYMADDEVWVHFDAKYRIEEILQVAKSTANDEDEEIGTPVKRTKREDLLKMHAYRDAIRRTAGAYVIYPGEQEYARSMYHELLPGLGAFPLKPTGTGEAEGVGGLRKFLTDIMEHLASQSTNHERSRYWVRESNPPGLSWPKAPAVPFLTRPPADTVILLGFVLGPQHLRWIHKYGMYNVRAGERTGAVELNGRELAAEFVILYGTTRNGVVPELWQVTGQPEIWTRDRMLRANYPQPQGELYFCFRLGRRIENVPVMPTQARIDAIRKAKRPETTSRPPVATTWLELVR